MIRLLSILLLSLIFILPHAYAQDAEKLLEKIKAPTADYSELKHTKSGRIDKIIDGLTLLLQDGTIIRLASLDIPDFAIWQGAIYSESALELLESTLPQGTEVKLYQTRMAKKGRITRMKHELAHIETKKDKIWIQGLMLANGLARVYTAPKSDEMLEQMLKAEQSARTTKLGIWEDLSEYPVLDAANIEEIEAQQGDFVIVEGIVTKAATVRNKLYLNFGKDWKTDFTVMITPDIRKKLARRGLHIMSMANERLRVRGWVKDYNGPMIELESAAHLEYPLNDTSNSTPPLQERQ